MECHRVSTRKNAAIKVLAVGLLVTTDASKCGISREHTPLLKLINYS